MDQMKIHNLFMAGFQGEHLPENVREMLGAGLGGVILFERNISSPAQVRQLTEEIRSCAREGEPLIAIDQEGGAVQRLRKLGISLPSARELGKIGLAAAEAMGNIIGRELAALGINTDFAPVLDVDSNPSNPIIGDRAYSSDPLECAELGMGFMNSLQAHGVLACGKHFPGHGDSSKDSHKTLPEINVSMETLRSRELVPFGMAVRAGIRMLMTSHCLYPCLDSSSPATLSSAVMDSLLRKELGFGGALISDDLHMMAISGSFSSREVIRLGIKSGLDIFLFCREPARAAEGAKLISELISAGEVSEGRIEESARRIAVLREWLGSTRNKRAELFSMGFGAIMEEDRVLAGRLFA